MECLMFNSNPRCDKKAILQNLITSPYALKCCIARPDPRLRYNFNPAQVFMGDTGSLFLGAAFASLSIMGALELTATVALAIPILIMGIPILDTTFAIVRRFFRGQPIFQADRGHLHHRLLRLGLSQRAAVLLIYAINILLGVLGVVLAFYGK